MALLPSVQTKISMESTRFTSAVSEFLIQTIGRSINWLIDRVAILADTNVDRVLGISVGQGGTFTVPAGYTFSGMLARQYAAQVANGRIHLVERYSVAGPVSFVIPTGTAEASVVLISGVAVTTAKLIP